MVLSSFESIPTPVTLLQAILISMAGNGIGILSESSFKKENVTGIGESIIQNLPLASVTGLVATHHGPAIVILNQYANYGKGHTIHSSSQLRAFGTLVHEAPCCKPLTVMAKADPLTCVLYAESHALLDTLGWKSLKCIAL
jgi:hypothetical protein